MWGLSGRLAVCSLNPLSLVAAGAILWGMTPPAAPAADAPDAPGGSSSWTTGAKNGLGTSTTQDSKVWFTLCQGIMTEVYYPQVDMPNVQDFQFIVTDGSTFVDLERDDTKHQTDVHDPRSLTYRQVNTSQAGRYQITKTYVTDPARPTVLILTRFQALSGGPYQLYVLYNPSLRNTGLGDTGAAAGKVLVANDGDIASALSCSPDFVKVSNGYSATASDGLVDLRLHKTLSATYDTASTPGNLVQIGQVAVGNDTTFVLALAFGSTRDTAAQNAKDSLAADFTATRAKYESGWHDYLASLKPAPACVTANNLTVQYNVALMALRAHEDKTALGAHVASLSIPWGNVVSADAPQPGYHHVWARDLYQIATAQLAAGDGPAAKASLKYLLDVQQVRNPTPEDGGAVLQPGAFPRYSKLDGSDPGCCEQLDEDSFPLILAWQLHQGHLDQIDPVTWGELKLTADHIVQAGPATPQERWEEQKGLSPSTLAAEIAGLVCAADMARATGHATDAARYEAKADEWKGKIETWTYTTNGYFGDKHYYERIDQSGNPNDDFPLHFHQEGPDEQFWEHDILDAGFLELVRLGVKPPNDPRIYHSLQVIDSQIKVTTPGGDMWHRYNHDAYGEHKDTGRPWTGEDQGTGRLWPLLSGERGEYELANGRRDRAVALLKTMASAANDGYMIPEQCWDQPDAFGFTFGKGTGSATPLAWSMAQFVRLAVSIDSGFPVETPKVVADRYGGGPLRLGTISFTVTVPAGTDTSGKPVYLAGELDQLDPSLPLWSPTGVKLTRVDATHWQAKVTGPQGSQVQYKYTLGDWGFVERGPDCAELPNRTFTVQLDAGSNMTVKDTVGGWRNIPPCGN